MMIYRGIGNGDITKEKSVVMTAVEERTVARAAYLGVIEIEERDNESSIAYTLWMDCCI